MKYLEIKAICEQYKIVKYTINEDGTVDVDGSVNLYKKDLKKLPLKFGKVTGSFSFSNNQLTSLEGCPNYVGGYFDCSSNQLTSLEGAPNYVGGIFRCPDNKLTSLEGCPNYVGNFYCYFNPLPQEIIDNPKAYLKQINRNKILDELLM